MCLNKNLRFWLPGLAYYKVIDTHLTLQADAHEAPLDGGRTCIGAPATLSRTIRYHALGITLPVILAAVAVVLRVCVRSRRSGVGAVAGMMPRKPRGRI